MEMLFKALFGGPFQVWKTVCGCLRLISNCCFEDVYFSWNLCRKWEMKIKVKQKHIKVVVFKNIILLEDFREIDLQV